MQSAIGPSTLHFLLSDEGRAAAGELAAPAELADVKAWIVGGAKWPADRKLVDK